MKKNKSEKELNVLINNEVSNKEIIADDWKKEIKRMIFLVGFCAFEL